MEALIEKLKGFIPQVSKAVAAALVAGTVALLLKYNINVPEDVQSSLNVVVDFVVASVLTGVAVYFAPKNSEK